MHYQFFSDEGEDLGTYEARSYSGAVALLRQATGLADFQGFYREVNPGDVFDSEHSVPLMHTVVSKDTPEADITKLFEMARKIRLYALEDLER